MDKEIKEIILKSLEVRKNRLTSWKFHNIPQAKRNIADWQREIDSKQEYSNDGMIQMKIYKDVNEKLIKKEKEWLEKAEKVVADVERAIEVVKGL